MLVSTWFAFFLACWAISLSPGAGAIASMSCGSQYGFARGYWNALGLQIGLALQIAIVAAGVGALLATSALAFSLIKWFGVAYLVYLAVRQWQAPPQALSTDGSGARRQADGPAGEEEGEPGTDEHCTPRKANAAGGGNEKASVHQGGAAAQVFRPRASPNLCGRNLADRKNPADAGLSRGYALSHVGQTTAMRLFALAPNALSPANPCAASPALRRACAPGLRASGCSAPPPPGRRPWRSRRSLSARALRRTRPPARCRPR